MGPNGKVALVTGAGSGIGRATALALAGAGASVVIADVDDAGGAETVRMVEGNGGKAAFVHTDVTRSEDLERMVAFAEERFGALHIVHNNAGISTPPPRFPAAPLDSWEKTVMIDLWAVIAGTQAAVPAIKRGGGGVIINTASLAGLIAYLPDPIYAAAKHGVVGFTRSLAFLKDEANIRVNCVCPGVVNTPMIRKGAASLGPEALAQVEETLSRMPLMTPETIANAVLTLITDDRLNGQALSVIYGREPRLIDPPVSFGHDPAQGR
ncbi:MAG: SDR family oxidoreductase [Dehalococcoidia bacterium]|nr:SDR family oxidoreductase [Dehalococcoidia bacterium]